MSSLLDFKTDSHRFESHQVLVFFSSFLFRAICLNFKTLTIIPNFIALLVKHKIANTALRLKKYEVQFLFVYVVVKMFVKHASISKA